MTTAAATAIASPARIMEVGMGFWPAKVLLSAIELGCSPRSAPRR